jgi:hypothetical protein
MGPYHKVSSFAASFQISISQHQKHKKRIYTSRKKCNTLPHQTSNVQRHCAASASHRRYSNHILQFAAEKENNAIIC